MIDRNIQEGNKLERLQTVVEDLQRKVDKLEEKNKELKDIQEMFENYNDNIRTDKAIAIKKNFVLKNRKGIKDEDASPGIDEKKDNVVQLYFNDKKDGRLNHIFLGSASLEGFYNTSVISLEAIKKDDIKEGNRNNGNIQIAVLREDDNGEPIKDREPNLSIVARENIPGESDNKGIASQLNGTGENPYVALNAWVDGEDQARTYLACTKDEVYVSGDFIDVRGYDVAKVHRGDEPPEDDDDSIIWIDTSE